MSEIFDDDAYVEAQNACKKFAEAVENACNTLQNAVEDCADNGQGTEEGPLIKEKMEPHIANFRSIAARAKELASSISSEQGQGDGAGGKLRNL